MRNSQRLTLFGSLLVLVMTLSAWLEPDPKGSLARKPFGSPAAAQPGARYGHTLTNVNGTVYLYGGANTTTAAPNIHRPLPMEFNDSWRFEQQQDFTQLAPPQSPPARRNHAAVAWKGKLYIFGGLSGTTILSDVWTYDPVANTWTQQTSTGFPPAGLWGSSAVAYGDFIYLFGGWTPSGMTRIIYKYDPSNGNWGFFGNDLPNSVARYGVNACLLGANFLVYGGAHDTQVFNDVNLYDPVYSAMTTLTLNGGVPAALLNAATVYTNGTFLTFGGEDATGTSTMTVQQLVNLALSKHPTTGTLNQPLNPLSANGYTANYSTLTPLPNARTQAAAAILDTTGGQMRVLIFGGLSNGQAITDTLIYTVSVASNYSLYLPLIIK